MQRAALFCILRVQIHHHVEYLPFFHPFRHVFKDSFFQFVFCCTLLTLHTEWDDIGNSICSCIVHNAAVSFSMMQYMHRSVPASQGKNQVNSKIKWRFFFSILKVFSTLASVLTRRSRKGERLANLHQNGIIFQFNLPSSRRRPRPSMLCYSMMLLALCFPYKVAPTIYSQQAVDVTN